MSANHITMEELRTTFDEKLAPLKVLILVIISYIVTSILLFALLTVINTLGVYVCVFVCIQSDMLPYCTPHNKLV